MKLLELRNFAPGWFSKVTYRFWHDTVTSRRLLSKSCSGTLLLLLSSIAKRFSTVKVIYTKPLPFFKRSRSLLKSGIKKQSSEMWFFFCYTWSLANRLNIRYSIWQYKPVGRAVLRYGDWLQKYLCQRNIKWCYLSRMYVLQIFLIFRFRLTYDDINLTLNQWFWLKSLI